jgi:hypothetical protein
MVAAGIAGGELCLTVSLLDAGVLPLTTMAGAPQPDPFVRDGIEPPATPFALPPAR